MENKWSYFSLKNLIPLRSVNRFDDKKENRFYYFRENNETQIAAGITSCFSAVSADRYFIDKWKEENANWRELFNISSQYGTLEHELFADIALNLPVSDEKLEIMEEMALQYGKSVNMPKKDMLAFMKFCEETEIEPMIIEGILVWKDDKGQWLAMTIDMLAKLKVPVKVKKQVENGVYSRGDKKGQIKYIKETEIIKEEKIIIIDFKSNFFEKDSKSFYETHKMQLIGAKRAVKQNFKIKVDDVYNWSPNNWRTEPSYTFYKHDLSETDYKLFDAYWDVITLKGINRPEGKMLVAGMKESKDFKFYSYKEYVDKFLQQEWDDYKNQIKS